MEARLPRAYRDTWLIMKLVWFILQLQYGKKGHGKMMFCTHSDSRNPGLVWTGAELNVCPPL